METTLTQITNYLTTQSWQIAVLAAAVAGVSLLLKNKSAHVRYLLWLIVLAKCLTPPLLTIPLAVLPQQQVPQPAALAPAEFPPLTIEPVRPAALPPVPPVIERPSIGQNLSGFAVRQWLPLTWISGFVLFLFVTIIKAFRTNSWLRRARRPLPAGLQKSIDKLFSELGIRRPPKLWLVKDIGQPFVWGLLRGGIYLPADFAKLDSARHRRGILGHELSHVLRFDAAVNLLQIIVQAVFWFHPFVWWANKKIRAEREKCCDEMAIARLNAEAKDYSTAIVNTLIAEHRAAKPIPSLAIAGPVKNIEDRIKTILSPDKKFYKRPSFIVVITILLLALIAVPTTLALTSRPPKKTDVQVAPEPLKRFEGRVVDANGSPVAGAKVRWFSKGDENLGLFNDAYFWIQKKKAIADAQGMFTLVNPANEKFGVYVKADGFANYLMVNLTLPEDAEKLKEIVLRPESKVFGRVVKDGQALPQASVTVSPHLHSEQLRQMLDSPWPSLRTRTDENGYYSVGGLPGGEVRISVMTAIKNLNMAQKKIRLQEAQAVELNFGDEPGFTLRGSVAWREKPLEGASVMIDLPDDSFKWDWTDTEGSFRITGIPKGNHLIFTRFHSGFNPKNAQWGPGRWFSDRRRVDVDGDFTLHIDLASNESAYEKTNPQVGEDEKQFKVNLPNGVTVEDSRNLFMERKDILQKTLQAVEQKYNNGRANSRQLQEAKIDLLRIESELAETPQKRIDILGQIVTLYLEQEKTIKLLLDAGRVTQGELNKVKLLRLDAENEFARAKAEGNEHQTDFKAILPNEVTVELVGVCEHPSKGKQWWRPDGSLTDITPYDRVENPYLRHIFLGPRSKGLRREFALRLSDLGKSGLNIRWHIRQSNGSLFEERPLKEGGPVQGLRAIVASIPGVDNTVRVDIGVASGAWKTIASGISNRDNSFTTFQGRGSFSNIHERDGKTILTMADTFADFDHRVIAIDKSEAIYAPTNMNPTNIGETRVTTVQFDDLRLENVKEFQFQTRPYEWVTFKNVSLRPGLKTNVQVELEKEKLVSASSTGSRSKVVGIGMGWWWLKRVVGEHYGGSISGYGSNESQAGEYYSKVLSWAKQGDTFVMLFAFDEHNQTVPEQYQDLLPRPWSEIESRARQGESMELQGQARGLNIVVLAAPTLEKLEQIIKQTELLNAFKNADVQVESTARVETTRRVKSINQTKTPSQPRPTNEAVYEQLEKVFDLSELTPEMHFADALDKLKNSVEPPLNVFVFWNDLHKEADVDRTSPIHIDSDAKVPLKMAFNLLLDSVSPGFADLTYTVANGLIYIGPKQSLRKKVKTSVHRISDVVGATPNLDNISGLVQLPTIRAIVLHLNSVAPAHWPNADHPA